MKPMLELLNRSPSDHAHVTGPIAPIKDIMPAQGFTAVNVLDRRQPSPPSENMSKESAQPSDRSGLATTSADQPIESGQQSRKSSGRNDSVLCSEPAIKQSPDTAKRKRSIAESIEPVGSGSRSPTELAPSKRRMTESSNKEHSSTPDELISVRDSNDRFLSTRLSTDFMNRDRGSREQSPVPTRYQRVAPPQVRPETEAHLAESLATHLQGIANDGGTTGDGHAPAGINSYNDPNSDAYNPDDNGADPTGKRKRNFSNRVKTGCHTCRNRKKKCDETKPTCTNCMRGGFGCLGYGPKPVGTKGPNTGNRAIYMQSKIQDPPGEPIRTNSSDGPRYSHWGRMPVSPTTQDVVNRYPQPHSPVETRRSSSRDWTTHPYHHQRDPSYPFNSAPPADYGHPMPPMAMYPNEPPPARDPWPHHNLPPYRSLPGPAAPTSLSSSIPPSTPHLPSSSPSERDRMLLGKPYLAHQDPTLRADTASCAAAIEAWTHALRAPHTSSPEHRSRLLAAVFDPALRPGGPGATHHDPASGKNPPPRIGHRVVISPPFAADYGYNVLLGDDVVLGPRCHFQDPCEISVGARSHVDAGVTFAGNAVPRCADGTSVAATGSQAALVGGPIVVEEDVWIGPGVVVEACRVLGRGCVVRAGAVVTRNVPPYTEVAGNPARVVRRLPRPGEGAGEPATVVGEPLDPEVRRENEEILARLRARRGWRE